MRPLHSVISVLLQSPPVHVARTHLHSENKQLIRYRTAQAALRRSGRQYEITTNARV